jgi:hypothetical protein
VQEQLEALVPRGAPTSLVDGSGHDDATTELKALLAQVRCRLTAACCCWRVVVGEREG